jgi:hypothetical protein
MVKASPFIAAFNAGEFSPRMDARVDFAKYENASSRALNLIALPQGGYTVRPGTRYVAELQSSAARGAIYGFSPRSGVSYILQFEAARLRFLRYQAQLRTATTGTTITNGTFAANITNWTDRSTGSGAIAWSASESGVMQITGTDRGYGWAEQAVTTALADRLTLHVVRFRISGAAGVKVTVQVGTATVGYDLFQASGYGIGYHTVEFTPGVGIATVYLQFINKDNRALFVDDVEILSNVPLELTSPYPVGTIEELRIARSNDVLILFHDAYQPYELRRNGDYSWSLQKFFCEDGPWQDINPDIDLEATNLVENGIFDGGLTGWDAVVTGDGQAEWDGAQSVVFLKVADAGSVEIQQDIVTGAPAVLHVIHFQIVGGGFVYFSVGTAASGVDIVASTAYEAGWYTVSFTPGVSPFHLTFARDTQDSTIVPGVGAVFLYNNRHNLLNTAAITGNTEVFALGDYRPFRSTDVNRLLRLEHAGREPGWAVITAYTNDQRVNVRWFRDAASIEPTEVHRLGAWSDTTGWPRVGAFFQQRLFVANTEDQPQTIWASVSGDFPNFRPDVWVEGAVTVEDDNALDYTLVTSSEEGSQVSPILWLSGTRRLIAGTASSQFYISSRGAALTPQDFTAEEHEFVQTKDMAPARSGNIVLFVAAGGQSVYDLGYNYEVDGLQAADLNILSDHMADDGFVQLAFQTRPYSLLWARKSGGTLAVLTYKREQNVVGWTPVEIAGTSVVVESIAVIPGQAISGTQVYESATRDEVWMIVKRTINGGTERYIEVMEGFFSGPNRAEYETKATWQTAMLTAQKDAVYVDSALTYSGVSTASITGLSHLEGQTVGGIANGVRITPAAVSGGAVAVPAGTTKAQIGLEYSPVYRSLKLPYGAQTGSSVGHTKQICEIVYALLDSCAFEYAVELDGVLTRRTASEHLDSNTLFTGEVRYEDDGGFDSDPRVWVWPKPSLPFTMLGLAPRVVTHEQ